MVKERRVAVTGDVSLRVLVDAGGAGAPVVLVHGLASNARMWDGVTQRLVQLGHPVAAVDLRGHGSSDRPDDGYDFATVTADVVAVIGALGFERPVVAGQSWGGNVVVELAARHPDRTGAIVCVDGGWLELRDRFESWEACAGALAPPAIAGAPAADVEASLRNRHPDWPETGISGALACFDVRADGTVAPLLSRDRHMAILRHLWEHRPSERWSQIGVPVTLVPARRAAGPPEGDSWAAATGDAVERAARTLAEVQVEWVEGDHDLHAQHPRRIAAIVHEAARGARP